jgi:hypothetical protein
MLRSSPGRVPSPKRCARNDSNWPSAASKKAGQNQVLNRLSALSEAAHQGTVAWTVKCFDLGRDRCCREPPRS